MSQYMLLKRSVINAFPGLVSGRRAVENYHHKAPYHLLKRNEDYFVGEPGSGNLVVQEDNSHCPQSLVTLLCRTSKMYIY